LIKYTIADELMEPWRCARNTANKLLTGLDEDPAEMLAVLTAKIGIIMPIDDSFAIELATIRALNAGAGAHVVEQSILACLPDEGDPITPEASLASLRALKPTRRLRMGGPSAASFLDAVLEVVDVVAQGRVLVEAHLNSSKMMLRVKDRLQHFVNIERPCLDPGEDDMGNPHSGIAALKILLTEATALQVAGKLTLSHIQVMVPFGYLLSEAETKELDRITIDTLKKTTAGIPKRIMSKSAASTSAKKQKQQACEDDDVMQFFK
jgi:hypothetical protein